MLALSNVTLIAIGSEKYREANQKAIDKSCEGITFGAVKNIVDDSCTTLDGYSRAMLFTLPKHVETDFALTVQQDGMVLRPHLWSDEFYSYDYIGAPWPPNMHFTNSGKEVRVGNGGFSFRSKRLLNAFNEYNLEYTDNGTGFFNEDGQICCYYRDFLEEKGFMFAPPEVAARFSTEITVPETVESFGGHKYL